MDKEFLKSQLAKVVMHGYRRIFLITLIVVFSVQIVVLIQDKLNLLYENMYQDFRIIAVVQEGSSQENIDMLFTTLNDKKSIYEAEYVSLDNVIEEFETVNPQLSKGVLKIEKNIFAGYFEIVPKKSVFGDMVSWIEKNVENHEIIEKVYYNLAQVDMMNNVNAFKTFLNFSIWFLILLSGLFFFFVETTKNKMQDTKSYRGLVSGALAGVFALIVLFVFLYPIKVLNPDFYMFLSMPKQLLIVAFGGFIGWVLYRWQER